MAMLFGFCPVFKGELICLDSKIPLFVGELLSVHPFKRKYCYNNACKVLIFNEKGGVFNLSETMHSSKRPEGCETSWRLPNLSLISTLGEFGPDSNLK